MPFWTQAGSSSLASTPFVSHPPFPDNRGKEKGTYPGDLWSEKWQHLSLRVNVTAGQREIRRGNALSLPNDLKKGDRSFSKLKGESREVSISLRILILGFGEVLSTWSLPFQTPNERRYLICRSNERGLNYQKTLSERNNVSFQTNIKVGKGHVWNNPAKLVHIDLGKL